MNIETTAAAIRTAFVTAARFGVAVIAFALLAATLPSAPAHAGLLLTDGTFTATSLSSPGGYICQNGSTAGSTCVSNLTDWTGTCSPAGCSGSSTPGSLLFAGATNVNFAAFNGNRGLYGTLADPTGGGNVVALDGDASYASSISQMISGLSVGDRYSVTFMQAAAQQNSTTGATTEQWKVSLNGSVQYSTLMHNASQGVVGWNAQTLNFIATAANETLTFFAVGTPSGAGEPPVVLLADVGFTDIPEPASLALLGAGILGAYIVRRRRAA